MGSFGRGRTNKLARLVEGKTDNCTLVVTMDDAELREVACALLGTGGPDEDLRVLAQLTGYNGHAILRVHVQSGNIIVVTMKVPLLVIHLVVHNAQCCVVVHKVAVLVVEEVGARTLARGVAVNKLQPQRVGTGKGQHAVSLTSVIGSDVVAWRKAHALERMVLEGVVERVVILVQITQIRAVVEIAVPIPFGRFGPKALPRKE
jgi:hypothetical protein